MDVRPGATIQLANCEIRYAGLNGYPALRLDASAAQVSDCRIHDNAYRGIIVNAAGAGATLDGMTIDHNGRGGIGNYGGTVALRNSAVYTNANGTTANGGGILNDAGGVLTIVNDSFWDNNGSNGAGAIANMSGTVTVLNSTFAGGSSWPNGTAAAIDNVSGSVTVTNSILADAEYGPKCKGTITDGGGNLRWPTADTSCVGTYGDPKLGALQDNGGPTWTMAISPGSAALGLGVAAPHKPAALACRHKMRRGRVRVGTLGGEPDGYLPAADCALSG